MAKITKKTSAKSKAPKGKAKVKATLGEGGKFDRTKLKTTWNAKQVAERRAVHNKVQVGNRTFGSVYKAFVDLGLPVWQHQAFRKVLKQAKRAPFTFKGKVLNFALAKD